MLDTIFMISVSMSAVIVLMLLVSPVLNKRYSAKWRYFVWLVLTIRLIVPLRLELPYAPVQLPALQDQTIVIRQEGIPYAVMDDSYSTRGSASFESADYAPVITLQELLFIVWAMGAIAFFLYHIINYLIFKRRIKPYCADNPLETLPDILDAMKIKNRPRVLECGRIASPMMTGFFQPVILIPGREYSDEELSVILKHELTHYKRGDIWYKLLLVVANAVHWFNPFVYIMVRQANRDLEYACDDAVVKDSDIDFRKQYSLTILKSMQKPESAGCLGLSKER